MGVLERPGGVGGAVGGEDVVVAVPQVEPGSGTEARRCEGAPAIIGRCCLTEQIVGRRAPKVVRHEETICWTHKRALHQVHGLGPGVIGAITALEHGPLEPGEVACELRRWEALARRGGVYRPSSNPCGESACCGHGPRGVLDEVIQGLPRWAKPELRRVVERVDEVYLRNTLPDPLADPGAPWWERRRPIGWPRA